MMLPDKSGVPAGGGGGQVRSGNLVEAILIVKRRRPDAHIRPSLF